jgi:hypothetical protein
VTAPFELMFPNFEGVTSPNAPRILEFEEQNERHSRWLTAFVGLGSNIFLVMLFQGA